MASKKKTTATKTSKSGNKEQAKQEKTLLSRAKSIGGLSILESVVIGVLGVLLMINPTGITKIIFYVVGIFLIVKGVYKILNYFAVHGKTDFYNNDLLYGTIALIFGILAVVFWEQLGSMIGLVVGAWVIYGALVRMNTAIKLHAAGVKQWFYVLLLSLAMMALGIYMLISVGAVLTIVGGVMIIAAVIGIIDDIVFMRNIDAIAK